jgi:MSHA biogenesis protein MshN
VSVINKMLRDLDARRVEGQLPDLQRPISPAGLQGTASVTPGRNPRPRPRRWLVLLAGALVLALVIFKALEAMKAQPSPAPAMVSAPPLVPQVPMPAPEPVPVQAATPAAPAEPLPPKATARAPALPSVPLSAPAPVAPKTQPSEPLVRAQVPPAPPSQPAVRDAPQAQTSVPAVLPPPATPAPAPVPVAGQMPPVAAPREANLSAERRQGAAIETLAQAQGLWNGGSREAGLDLLREAVMAVERAQPRDTELLARLVREQVRMELALGRAGNALALLTRLETDLSQQPDLWAVRGNAAQRLGRHAEAVHAYLAALQLRPGEQRWMLGAAVSLAAQGQLEAAGVQVEQARALGPVSPEVLTYLRQAGVALR